MRLTYKIINAEVRFDLPEFSVVSMEAVAFLKRLLVKKPLVSVTFLIFDL